MRHIGSFRSGDIIALGPIIEVTLEATRDEMASRLVTGLPTPSPLSAKVRIDTGAQVSVIEDTFIGHLGLSPDRYSSVVGVSQQTQICPVYQMVIAVAMLDDDGIRSVIAVEFEIIGGSSPEIPRQHVGLLGRDFLQHFEFIYRGHLGTFELIFPNPLPTQ